jgi:prepilin peptidase CpaA
MIVFVIVFCVLIAVGFGIASAVSDFKSLQIPNLYSLCIVGAFIAAYAVDALTGNGLEFFSGWKSHLLSCAIVFGATFALFGFKLIGAGDSKLCTAFALWVGLTGLTVFLFYMSIIGALLGLATKIMQKRILVANPVEGSWIAKAQSGANDLPYGIAITLGAIIAFYLLGYFSPEKLAALASASMLTEN